jgi:hypothetical protein
MGSEVIAPLPKLKRNNLMHGRKKWDGKVQTAYLLCLDREGLV